MENRFLALLKRDKTHAEDKERQALFMIISGNDDLYKKVDHIYDFRNHSIKIDCLGYTKETLEENMKMGESWMSRCSICELPLTEIEQHTCAYCMGLPDFCSSSKKLIRLAFNLYNGYTDDNYNNDVLHIFSNLDSDNFELALTALRIRFNRNN